MKIQSRYKNFETAIGEEKMRERFQRELKNIWGDETKVSKLYITRAFPRKEGGFTIQYELYQEKSGLSKTKKSILCGHLLEPGKPWPNYIANSSGHYFVLDYLRLIVPIFPYDPSLRSLEKLTDIQKNSYISKILGTMLGADIEIAGFEILGYRLEKRCVLRYVIGAQNGSSDQKKIVAKAVHRSRFSKLLATSMELENKGFNYHSDDGLTVPRILGSDDELCAIFMENAPGLSLHFLIEKVIFPDACSAAGRALRKLHNLDAGDQKIYTKLDELGNLQRLLELINNMFPEFKDAFNKKFNALSNNLPDDPADTVYAHRDFFDKQILFHENRSTLLDCDNVARADPALDSGNFIAHLTLRQLQHPDCSANIEKGIGAFIKSYDKSDNQFQSRTRWWTEASLLRLSALYLLRPRWRTIVPDLLTRPIDLFG